MRGDGGCVFTVLFSNFHSFLPLVEFCLWFQESKSGGLGLPVGLTCFHLRPVGTRPTTGRALSPS